MPASRETCPCALELAESEASETSASAARNARFMEAPSSSRREAGVTFLSPTVARTRSVSGRFSTVRLVPGRLRPRALAQSTRAESRAFRAQRVGDGGAASRQDPHEDAVRYRIRLRSARPIV